MPGHKKDCPAQVGTTAFPAVSVMTSNEAPTDRVQVAFSAILSHQISK
jgi:hypothetical protein